MGRRICLRACSYLFGTLSAILLCAGLLTWHQSVQASRIENDPLRITPVVSFGEARSDSQFPVRFSVENLGTRPIKILGSTFICTPQGCLWARDFPLLIPTHETRVLEVRVKTRQVGDFNAGISLYTDCRTKPQIGVVVRGRVIERP